jgi:hypothetical protein
MIDEAGESGRDSAATPLTWGATTAGDAMAGVAAKCCRHEPLSTRSSCRDPGKKVGWGSAWSAWRVWRVGRVWHAVRVEWKGETPSRSVKTLTLSCCCVSGHSSCNKANAKKTLELSCRRRAARLLRCGEIRDPEGLHAMAKQWPGSITAKAQLGMRYSMGISSMQPFFCAGAAEGGSRTLFPELAPATARG